MITVSRVLRSRPGAKKRLLRRGWHVVTVAMVLVMLFTPAAALAEEPWTSGWPTGQPDNAVTALSVAPSDGRVINASTNAALYRSTDGGATWKTVSLTANIVALAIDPKNPDVVYTYLWPGPDRPDAPPELRGLRKSVDGGQTWSDPSGGVLAEFVGSAVSVPVLAIDPTDPQTLFVGTGTDARIFRSADGGQTWQETYSSHLGMQPTRMVAIAVHPRDHNVVYAAHTVYHGGTLLVSNDGGLSWQPFAGPQLPLSLPAALALDPRNTNIVYVAYQAPVGGGVHIFRTSYAGGPWTELSEGLAVGGTAKPHLIVDPHDQRVLYLALRGDVGSIYRTTDRGDSWTRLAPEGDPRFGRDLTTLGYSATERVLLAGTNEGVWRRVVLPAIADSLVQYYDDHDGWRVMGRPISAPTWIDGMSCQYFEKGRLEDHVLEVSDPNWRFMYGLLVDELQEARAELPVGGDTSTISYADIGVLASPERRVGPPAGFTGGVHRQPDGSVFVPFDASLQPQPGHNVAAVLWSYINRTDLFPGGWLHDIGLPITEPMTAIVDKGDVRSRQITIQAFQRTVLTYDPLNPAEWQVERANVGTDYAKAFPDRVR